jgi:hypothetical protein
MENCEIALSLLSILGIAFIPFWGCAWAMIINGNIKIGSKPQRKGPKWKVN